MKSRVKGIWGVKEMKRLFCMAIRKGMKLDAANCWEEAQICESEEFEIKTRVSVSFYIVQILSAVAKRQIVTLLLNKPEFVVAVWFPSRQPKGMVPPKAGKEMLVFPPTLQSCFPSLPFLSIKVLDVAVQWLNANFVHKKKKRFVFSQINELVKFRRLCHHMEYSHDQGKCKIFWQQHGFRPA